MSKKAIRSPNQVTNNARAALKQSLKPTFNQTKQALNPNFNAQRPMNAGFMRPKPSIVRRNSPSQS
jgi:hypothetical protein